MDVPKLTLEQKTSLLSGRDMWATKAIDDAAVASLNLVDGPHGIRWQDGPDGYDSLPATCFPPAVAVGSSWDPQVAARLGAALGIEARAFGVTVSLGPGVNIKRSPLCGRNFEYYAEDPLLSGVLAAAHVQGLQEQGVAASLKHFAANNQENYRFEISAEIDERTLREIYLPAFEHVVKHAHPATVMCAYNKLNGVFTSQHRWLLTDVLRTEWGFDGVVMSDWGAVHDRVAALKAGLDLQMPGSDGIDDAKIVQAVRDGDVDEALVDASAARLVQLATLAAPATGTFDAEAHHTLARQLAADCAVLLKNDGDVLPITPALQRIAVIGEFAISPRFQGGGSSHVTPTRLDTALEAIRDLAAGHGQSVTYASGLADGAQQIAAEADIAVVFAGLAEVHESEGFDREHIDLPAGQVELIRTVAAAARRTVVVLSHGAVVSLEGWHDDVEAILEGWLLGQASGSALADLLFGVVNPSGRLAETIPLRLQDVPSHLNFPGEAGRALYGERVMVGYRYYATADVPVRYPFGHGLSYTTFTTGDLRVSVTGDDTATVCLTVTNTGARAGKHVVQLYVATEAGRVRRPARELRAFTKIALEPGQSTVVDFNLDRRAFAYYDVEESGWVVAPGGYTVQIGDSAARIVAEQSITLAGDDLVKKLSLDSTFGEWYDHPEVGPVVRQAITDHMTEKLRTQIEGNPRLLRLMASAPMHWFINTQVKLPDDEVDHMIKISKERQA